MPRVVAMFSAVACLLSVAPVAAQQVSDRPDFLETRAAADETLTDMVEVQSSEIDKTSGWLGAYGSVASSADDLRRNDGDRGLFAEAALAGEAGPDVRYHEILWCELGEWDVQLAGYDAGNTLPRSFVPLPAAWRYIALRRALAADAPSIDMSVEQFAIAYYLRALDPETRADATPYREFNERLYQVWLVEAGAKPLLQVGAALTDCGDATYVAQSLSPRERAARVGVLYELDRRYTQLHLTPRGHYNQCLAALTNEKDKNPAKNSEPGSDEGRCKWQRVETGKHRVPRPDMGWWKWAIKRGRTWEIGERFISADVMPGQTVITVTLP